MIFPKGINRNQPLRRLLSRRLVPRVPRTASEPNDVSSPTAPESTFAMRVASRLTGVSPERLRAWETRHAAIRPLRTEGGSRRYTQADLDRIRALRQLTDEGRRIAELASLGTDELFARIKGGETPEPTSSEVASALFERARPLIERLDGTGLRSLLCERIDFVGLVDFARTEALALTVEIGERWERGELSISAEHLATNVLRAVLVEKLGELEGDGLGPRILFATPSGEPHDVALLVAAIVAASLGASSLFVGADVPDEDLVATATSTRADVLALGFVLLDPDEIEARLTTLRRQLPERVGVWLGGRGIDGLAPIRGVDRVGSFDRLSAFVLEARGAADGMGARGEAVS
jgi:DNA-binding transcriptional MerR regulator